MDREYLIQNAVNFVRGLPVRGIDETFALARFPLEGGKHGNYLAFTTKVAPKIAVHLRQRQISDELVFPIIHLAELITPGLRIERVFSSLPLDAYDPVDHKDRTFSFYCQSRGRDDNGDYISPVKRNGRPTPRTKNLVSTR
ncbi:hypothetical protein CO038_02800 [Candidatus Pacearchaeota archaeon CG_4_9_14_0_2_um_filter_39_13]|nr:hypothetical protein [Candidatus Pacearchaeota archaeon]OIO42867.1 MAG: hypothetical protein AUJ64_03455 [Candidatus Pacearchaeota archaeon CG1_02_39_14]PJC44616.1 MAG: hypothetical protein CO038_02800 [Candidatus Pacearchaeota archaeon CG_4_9_14_0_2_um_filter_39_13]